MDFDLCQDDFDVNSTSELSVDALRIMCGQHRINTR